jgi:hypothetical protein
LGKGVFRLEVKEKMASQHMREIDIQSVDPFTLVCAADVSVDLDLPKPERMRGVVNQMSGNPYFFRSRDNIAVKVSYADTSVSFDERMEYYLRTL